MAQRKMQQEIDKTFKKVAEGIQIFDGILDKIEQASNASQKDKLEDALKREIKKLQRLRDQIKTWAAGNEIKDKKPLLEQRKNIEGCMEKFKAVEKEMKTKAFSKEGLNAPGKRDPKEQEKEEVGQFLSDMIGELERQIETLEAEEEQLQATAKKGKKDTGKTDRLQEISRKNESHQFHIGKLELLRRALENGNVETEKVQEKKEEIEYYVNDNMSVDFMEEGTDEIYDDLNLEEEDGVFGVSNDNDRLSSQDAQSTADDPTEGDRGGGGAGTASISLKPKSTSSSEPTTSGARRPSNNFKSPLPALATLHTPLPTTNATAPKDSMKPAPLPTRPPGETLKYASAAAAAASASDKSSVGIAPLPPPPSSSLPTSNTTVPAVASASTQLPSSTAPSIPPGLTAPTQPQKSNSTASPSLKSAQMSLGTAATTKGIVPATNDSEQSLGRGKAPISSVPIAAESVDLAEENNRPLSRTSASRSTSASAIQNHATPMTARSLGAQSKINSSPAGTPQKMNGEPTEAEESIYHLPPSLQDLVDCFETTRQHPPDPESPSTMRLLLASQATRPDHLDADKPHHYRPETKYATPSYYPQEPFTSVDDPGLYSKVDTDTLFYIFYYRQNTYQQYLAAKALKSQSWRFHKQYQTWFQRHEEPKTITEEYEQGTYRFFDYESTWMNRRKADFKFAYKFLEDDL